LKKKSLNSWLKLILIAPGGGWGESTTITISPLSALSVQGLVRRCARPARTVLAPAQLDVGLIESSEILALPLISAEMLGVGRAA